MIDTRSLTINLFTTVRDAMRVINHGACQIALVVDNENFLQGIVTDGDIRRALLNGITLDDSISKAMNANPVTLAQGTSVMASKEIMRENGFSHLPVVDDGGYLIGLMQLNDATNVAVIQKTTPIIIMAGGLGLRLRPLTENLPKPMLLVGKRPVLEQIIRQMKKQGFKNFTLSLNYLSDIIRAHFGNGESLGVRIDYIEEIKRMGTAGALSLLKNYPNENFIVMNADVLTTATFDSILDFHVHQGSIITVFAREFNMQVPYGVFETDGTRLISLKEKPSHQYLINAGIYVLSPEVFKYIQHDELLDMPTLINKVLGDGGNIAVYSSDEYWIDIGSSKDLDRARAEYGAIFGD